LLLRELSCDAKTISKQAVNFGIGTELEMYTPAGLRSVNLIMEDELNNLFSAMLKSKVKQTTKDKIVDVQSRYANSRSYGSY
jgi:hypothetical protein